ncbi:MAG: aconitate hydratase, partial [Xanthomonadales bacterium]|nr:aconitate hydratase [Xanthomonadales bacterium]
MNNSFGTRATLTSGGKLYHYHRLPALAPPHNLARLPYSLKILLENLLRFEDGENVTPAHIEALLNWDPKTPSTQEIPFMPARVVMQDFTGVPCVVDLAAMRDAMKALGGDPKKINPLIPAELVIDHSVQVDRFGRVDAVDENARIEFERNQERYAFLRWGQTAFDNFQVVPPRTGIVHQVTLEFLARVVFATDGAEAWAYPDT